MLVGCSFTASAGKPEVPADKLAATVAERLATTTGQPKPDVTCPEDLVGEVGNSTKCNLTAKNGSTVGVSVKVTSVNGDKVKFDIKADDTVSPATN
ncbi:DUF4333 domain-containing protein [Streptomyces chryseus]